MFIKMSKKVKIRGVFASWTMTEVERKPEARFRSKLETNPTYPFIPVSESHRNILVYRRRSRKIVAGVLALFVACAFALALYYSQRSSFAEGGLSVFCVPAFIGVWALATVVLNLQVSGSQCPVFTLHHEPCSDVPKTHKSWVHRYP